MDNLIQLAMQIVFCLLIAAILGAIIGYLLGKMSRCDDKEKLNSYEDDYNKRDIRSSESETTDSLKNISNPNIETTLAATTGIAATGATLVDEKKDIDLDIENSHDEIKEQIKKNIKDIEKKTAVGQEIGIRPQAVEAPTDREWDDLKEISGIGLKIEEVLHSLGIYYFKQIANWSDENIEWIEDYLVLKGRVKKEDWIGQAKLLSAGGHTEFSQKVRRGENRNY